MKNTLFGLLAAAALAFSLPAAAQQSIPFSNELSVFGSWEDMDEPVNVEQTDINLRYGRVIQPQLVGTVGLRRSRFEGGGIDAASSALLVGAKYYITPPRGNAIVPFLDAAVGLAITDNGQDDSTDLTWELGGGVSWFFTQATSFDVALRFFHTDTDIETKGTRITIGLTTRF